MMDEKEKVEYIFVIIFWLKLYTVCEFWTLVCELGTGWKELKNTLKTDMNYWKVSFLYPQIVHDYTTALTIAHIS